jgi:hypothetical protein
MAMPDIDGDPVSPTLLSVMEKAFGGSLPIQEASLTKDVRNGSGTIVALIVEHGVSPAPFVGQMLEAVTSFDRLLDGPRGPARGIGVSVAIKRSLAMLETVNHRIVRLDLSAAG